MKFVKRLTIKIKIKIGGANNKNMM